MAPARVVKVKRTCCKSDPRCRACPVVAKRLADAGLAERVSKRRFLYRAPKRVLRAARRGRLAAGRT